MTAKLISVVYIIASFGSCYIQKSERILKSNENIEMLKGTLSRYICLKLI